MHRTPTLLTIAASADRRDGQPSTRLASIRRRTAQLLRYGAVSAIATTTSMVVLGALVYSGAMGAVAANVLATAVGTVPSFELNRRWVWGKRGRRSLLSEVGPFVALSFAGLALSSLTVGLAASWAASASFDATARTLVVEAANVGAFGSLWVLQFVLLDRVLFRRGPGAPGEAVERELGSELGGVPAAPEEPVRAGLAA